MVLRFYNFMFSITLMPGLVVVAEDSQTRGPWFESCHHAQDELIFAPNMKRKDWWLEFEK